jgi:hypothetical protein
MFPGLYLRVLKSGTEEVRIDSFRPEEKAGANTPWQSVKHARITFLPPFDLVRLADISHLIT